MGAKIFDHDVLMLTPCKSAHVISACGRGKVILLLLHAFPARRQGASADKLQLKAAKFLPLDGLARSKQDPINRRHGAQY